MFSWCFLSVLMYFSIVRNLSREPDFWAENRIFKKFSKSLKTCFVGVFWVFQGIFSHCSTSEPRTGFLSREPDFQKILKKPQNMFNWCFLIVSCFFFSLVMNPGLSYVRLTTSYIRYRAENYVIPKHHMTHSKWGRPPGQWWLATTLR